jgi:hypothetical protein
MAPVRKEKGQQSKARVDPQTDSDWSLSEDESGYFDPSPPRNHTKMVTVTKADITQVLNTLVEHGLAVSGKVEKDGEISFRFRSVKTKEKADQPVPGRITNVTDTSGPGAYAPVPEYPSVPPLARGCYYDDYIVRPRHRKSSVKKSHKRKHVGWFGV